MVVAAGLPMPRQKSRMGRGFYIRVRPEMVIRRWERRHRDQPVSAVYSCEKSGPGGRVQDTSFHCSTVASTNAPGAQPTSKRIPEGSGPAVSPPYHSAIRRLQRDHPDVFLALHQGLRVQQRRHRFNLLVKMGLVSMRALPYNGNYRGG